MILTNFLLTMPSKLKKSKDYRYKVVKSTVKYLTVCNDPEVCRHIIQRAPKGVIQAISNASLNALRGDVFIPPHLKNRFASHRNIFEELSDRRIPTEIKRELLTNQKGGAFFLPLLAPLLGTVIGSLGSAIISKIRGQDNDSG